MYITVIIPQFLPYKLTYRVPQQMQERICCGVRVEVPSGRSKVTTALVSWILTPDEVCRFEALMSGKKSSIKEILSVIDTAPIANDYQLRLWQWMASYYMCSEGEVMRYFLPNDLIVRGSVENGKTNYKKNSSLKKERFLTLHPLVDTSSLLETMGRRQKELLSYFLDIADGSLKVSYQRLCEGGFNSTHIRKAITNEMFIESYEMIFNDVNSVSVSDIEFEEALKTEFYDGIVEKSWLPLLIQSDNREQLLPTYLYMMNERLAKNESVLILVSEEDKYDDVVEQVQQKFGERAVSFLSTTTQSRKYKNYCSLLSGEGHIIIGNKMAVGLPFYNLSLIIVTDEHSGAYKTENSPRFMARDAALMLAHIAKSTILLESFAPSVESFYNTTIGKYNFLSIASSIEECDRIPIDKYSIASKERKVYGNIPQVRYFSKLLLKEMEETLIAGKQTLLFHNRRGYNSFLLCKDCGWVLRCNNCNVSMTYHKEKRALVCHYCGEKVEPVTICGSCGSKNLQLKGVGSENIEESIKKYFPLTSVLRLDSDQLSKKEYAADAQRIITNKEAGIIVGTWLTIPYTAKANFGLVGIIDADTIFNVDDFRAEERAFRMMTQLSKRSKGGKMIIQCSDMKRPIVQDIVKGDYLSMVQRELVTRKQFMYPPYVRSTRITVKHKSEDAAFCFATRLVDLIVAETGLTVSCPDTPMVDKVRGMYLFYITLKFSKNGGSEDIKRKILKIIEREKDKTIQLVIDVD